jgi:CRISPR/Cas system-associated endoribonuclease Cas2
MELQQFTDTVRRGQIEEALKQVECIDWAYVGSLAENGDLQAVTALSMSAELLDYVGKLSEAKLRLHAVEKIAEKLLRSIVEERVPVNTGHLSRQHLKRWVWVLMQAANSHYRTMKLDRASILLDLCEKTISSVVQTIPEYPCYGTLCRLNYLIGLIHREGFDYSSAKERFLKSIEFAWHSLNQKRLNQKGAFQPTFWTDLAIARALGLGLGFVYHAEGQADLALSLLLSAKNLLVRLEERIISTYVDLIYHEARRSAYGDDPAVVEESITGLRKCREVFIEIGHNLYRARADYSLALAFSQRARHDETTPLTRSGEEYLKLAAYHASELAEYGIRNDDSRAEINAKLCQSRIERKQNSFLVAERLASEVIAATDTHPRLRVTALIARAEALARQQKIDSAIADFREASERCGSNLRTRAICLLRLADIYATIKQTGSAAECLEQWGKISPIISNAYLRRLERTAIVSMEASDDFVIRITDQHLNPADLEERLRKFLVRWAYTRAGRDVGDEQAADKLGISRQTFIKWKKGRNPIVRLAPGHLQLP